MARFSAPDEPHWVRIIEGIDTGSLAVLPPDGSVVVAGRGSDTISLQGGCPGPAPQSQACDDDSDCVGCDGDSRDAGGAPAGILASYSPTGTLRWFRLLGSAGDDTANAVAASPAATSP